MLYIIFVLIMLCKSSCLQSCLGYWLHWKRHHSYWYFFSITASYGEGMSILILESLCQSLLWRVPAVHLTTCTCNIPPNTFVHTPQYHEDVCWQRFNALLFVNTEILSPPKDKTMLSHLFSWPLFVLISACQFWG